MNLLAAEWIKLRTVRSTPLTLLSAVVAALGIGLLATSSPAPEQVGFDAVGSSFTGLQFGVLAFGVLGALAVSSEYGTGTIRTTFLAVPRRETVFVAKALVVGTLALVLGELIAFATFFLGQAMLADLGVGLGEPGVLRAVAGTGLGLGTVAMIGFGLGALVRHTAGAIAAMFGVVFLSYAPARALEGWSYLPSRWVPANALEVVGQVHAYSPKPRLPSAGMAFVELAVYVVVALGLGAWRFSRDA